MLQDNVSIAITLQGSSSGPFDQVTAAVGAEGAFSYLAPVIPLFNFATGTYVISATDSYGATGTTTYKYNGLCSNTVTVSFATGNATWGPSGAAQGVFVPVSNDCWPGPFSLPSRDPEVGRQHLRPGGRRGHRTNQTVTVFCQDYLTNVPARLYAVTSQP